MALVPPFEIPDLDNTCLIPVALSLLASTVEDMVQAKGSASGTGRAQSFSPSMLSVLDQESISTCNITFDAG
jgi:hypothetical protein